MGRTILLSLEILVAADLIRTVAVDPSLENVGALALIVLIRTILSFSLDIEIEGRLPWRARAVRRSAGGVKQPVLDASPIARDQPPVSNRRGLSTKIVSTSASVTPRSRSMGTKSVTM